jgi:hypothetical protein
MLWVGQFGIAAGEAREDTPWVGAYPDPGRDEDTSDLYVLLHPALPGSEEFLGEMKDAIGEAFHREKASLTGGVLRALRSAHENLRDWNRRSLREHRVAAGVACLATRDGRGYLAQVAPAAAVWLHGARLNPITPELPDATEPLGLYDDFWPQFTAFDFEEGDRLLLLSPNLLVVLEPEPLTQALQRSGEDALPELYRQARDVENCGALLVAAEAGPPEPEPSED